MAAAPIPAPPHRVLRATDNFRWPGGKRVAVVFNFAYEGWSDGEAPGIGVDIDEALAAKYPYRPAQLPINRLEDGAMTNW